MKKGRIVHNFPGSNTPEGFRGFMEWDLRDMERIFVLKGGPGCGKSTLMKRVARNMAERGYDVEVWPCSSAPESLDGVIIPELAVAVVDGTAPHIVEPRLPGVVEEIVNLGEHWNQSQLREHKDEIRRLTGEISASFERVYAKLAQGEEARREAVRQEDYALPEGLEPERLAAGLAEEIFGQERLRVRKFFAEAITRGGRQSYAQELSAACRWRYLLAGTLEQVSDVLQRVADAAYERGHNMDLYYSCFQPELLEMVVIPGLSVCLVAGFCPELEPRYEDIVVRLMMKRRSRRRNGGPAWTRPWLDWPRSIGCTTSWRAFILRPWILRVSTRRRGIFLARSGLWRRRDGARRTREIWLEAVYFGPA